MLSSIFNDKAYIDFHTHNQRQSHDPDVLEIISIHLGQDKASEYFTIGMHPWWTEDIVTAQEKAVLVDQLSQQNCLALGEIGLDKLKGPSLEKQEAILHSLLKIADAQQMPVIIHCVRATDHLIQAKKAFPGIKKWCIHGYGRHATLAKQLIDQGFYLSLMPGMPEEKLKSLFDAIPRDRYFLETDSMPEANIINIYAQVARLLAINIDDLCAQIKQNAIQFFGR